MNKIVSIWLVYFLLLIFFYLSFIISRPSISFISISILFSLPTSFQQFSIFFLNLFFNIYFPLDLYVFMCVGLYICFHLNWVCVCVWVDTHWVGWVWLWKSRLKTKFVLFFPFKQFFQSILTNKKKGNKNKI